MERPTIYHRCTYSTVNGTSINRRCTCSTGNSTSLCLPPVHVHCDEDCLFFFFFFNRCLRMINLLIFLSFLPSFFPSFFLLIRSYDPRDWLAVERQVTDVMRLWLRASADLAGVGQEKRHCLAARATCDTGRGDTHALQTYDACRRSLEQCGQKMTTPWDHYTKSKRYSCLWNPFRYWKRHDVCTGLYTLYVRVLMTFVVSYTFVCMPAFVSFCLYVIVAFISWPHWKILPFFFFFSFFFFLARFALKWIFCC